MPDVIHVSSVAGSPLLDSAGERLGRVEDVIVRMDDPRGLPPVFGLEVKIGGREMFVPIDRVEQFGPDVVRTSTTKLNLAQFERREGEILLRRDILDRRLINVTTARLVTAREVELVRDSDGTWRVAGIDPSFRPRLWRLLPRRFRGHDADHRQFISWTDLEPFVGHVPTSRLKLAARRLVRLHPAQIADLVEAASHEEGEEILEAVAEDKELEADVFEELDDEHQVEFLRERSDKEAAEILARMDPDDAADLLLELDQERRLPVLNLLPAANQHKIRSLLGYNPSTAGGLMNPDFVSVLEHTTAADALERVRASDLSPRELTVVCVVDQGGKLTGAVSLSELVHADPQQRVGDLVDAEAPDPTVALEADLPEIALVMTDYNLIAIPVVDSDCRPAGLISVDDVLDKLVPEEWRRRAGAGRS
jgi:CBS domain-containing protein/sporulation protein YlmC with PRC-barrel domain